MDVGFVYLDDVPPFVADLPCPACGRAYLYRRLALNSLKPKSAFPQTFKAEGHRSWSTSSPQLLKPADYVHWARAEDAVPHAVCGAWEKAEVAITLERLKVSCPNCLTAIANERVFGQE